MRCARSKAPDLRFAIKTGAKRGIRVGGMRPFSLIHDVEQALRRLAPGAAAAAALTGDVDELIPTESSVVSSRGDARRREFVAGRRSARRALRRAGGPAGAILRGGLGEPIWPDGFGGSIAHDGGVAVALAWRITPASPLNFGVDLLNCGDLAIF